ncbi:MAG: hypothetical protein AB7U05_09170 [Mangrovibacterium sp.]
MFWKTYRQWLIKLINQRLHLCRHGYTPELRQPTLELKRLIDYHGYQSDRLFAAFFARKAEIIQVLIPTNQAYDKQTEMFYQGLHRAKEIISQP